MENIAEKDQKTINILETLIIILDDGKLGYTNAAEDVDDAQTKIDFLGFAKERSMFIVELQNEIHKLGKSTATEGGPMGALHRTWIDIKSLFTGGDRDAIINACITGERAAIEEYEQALKEKHFNPMLRPIILDQLASIKETLSKIEKKKSHLL
ncbi:ferritin-like domain-containing protein [Flavobacterium algicola]|uniref:ferritin-like domain-containing protein n=1 Tax=Flavobacterium algicola TaxID=556529 RepID=UPI001EFD8852|nr:PA2169 family four-helix-bundle protein [Flavobacterium algicola]MCG9791435.1 PA2169 family four-helix-bundle protein [Flavobacterium algicola]